MELNSRFSIGQRVQCIEDEIDPQLVPAFPNWIKKGEIYTVRTIYKMNNGIGICVEEIVNPIVGHMDNSTFPPSMYTYEPNFNQDRFVEYIPEDDEDEDDDDVASGGATPDINLFSNPTIDSDEYKRSD